MKTCTIFGAGDYLGTAVNISSLRDSYIIAADGGMLYLDSLGITPDILIGDFDSMDEQDFPHVSRHPVMKDDTDMMLAIKHAFEQGCDRFVIYGGLGGRLDHTYANIQSLRYICEHSGVGFLVGGNETVTVIKNAVLSFDETFDGIVSVFSADKAAHGVTLTGLLYPLEDYTLTNAMPLGVSNHFTGKKAAVKVSDGNLIVMWENHKDGRLPGIK